MVPVRATWSAAVVFGALAFMLTFGACGPAPSAEGATASRAACPCNFVTAYVGQELDGWIIAAIELRPGEGRVLARRGDDEVEFAFSGPAGSAPPGRYDHGAMRLGSRSASVEPSGFQRAGEQLAGILAAGVDSVDPGPWIDAQLAFAREQAPRCGPDQRDARARCVRSRGAATAP